MWLAGAAIEKQSVWLVPHVLCHHMLDELEDKKTSPSPSPCLARDVYLFAYPDGAA